MNIKLSSQGLGNINQEFLPDDFTFVIDGCSYSCNKIQADFISPKISKIHKVDPLIDTFKITNIEDPDGEFQAIIDFLKEGQLKMNPQKGSFYIQVFGQLGNSEIIDNLLNIATDRIEKETIQRDKLIETLILIDQLDIYNKNSFFDYAATQFSDICNDIYDKSLSYNTIFSIVSSSSLKLENESQLVSFILNIVEHEKDETFLSLIEYVDFEYISFNDLISLQSILEDYQISLKIIIDKLFQKIISKTSKIANIFTFEYDENKQNKLSGIINYLNHKSNGIASKNGTVNVTCSSVQNNYYLANHNCSNLCDFTDLSDKSMWSPDNEENSYVQFDFINNKICMSNYTLHTPTADTKDYPKSWIVQCSNDLNEWITVDKQIDQSVMNKRNSCQNFKCQFNNNQFFRYVRITSQGPCWNRSGRYYFDISAVEFFGFFKMSN